MTEDPAAVCRALRALAAERPNPRRIAEVEARLNSKYQSVQAVAAQVLAGWSSHRSLPLLRDVFEFVSLRRSLSNHVMPIRR